MTHPTRLTSNSYTDVSPISTIPAPSAIVGDILIVCAQQSGGSGEPDYNYFWQDLPNLSALSPGAWIGATTVSAVITYPANFEFPFSCNSISIVQYRGGFLQIPEGRTSDMDGDLLDPPIPEYEISLPPPHGDDVFPNGDSWAVGCLVAQLTVNNETLDQVQTNLGDADPQAAFEWGQGTTSGSNPLRNVTAISEIDAAILDPGRYWECVQGTAMALETWSRALFTVTEFDDSQSAKANFSDIIGGRG